MPLDARQLKGTHKTELWDKYAHTHSWRVSSALGSDGTASGKAGDEAEFGAGGGMVE